MNINNFLHSILIINKIANSNLPSEIKKLFELNTNDKSIQASVVRDGLIKCIKNQELLNDSALIKLNNNVFYKNEKIKTYY